MKAVAWHGKEDVRVDTVPDPKIEEPTGAIVRITSTAICGSELHLYEILGICSPKPDREGPARRGSPCSRQPISSIIYLTAGRAMTLDEAISYTPEEEEASG